MRARVSECTICGTIDVMRYQCQNCHKWSCGKVDCLKYMGEVRNCKVPKNYLPGGRYFVAQEMKF